MNSESALRSRYKREAIRNYQIWCNKPLLQRIYFDFYRLIEANLQRDIRGKIIEVGSGYIGCRLVIDSCEQTDVFHDEPTLTQVDVYSLALAYGSDSLSNIIMFDVFHHLEFPGDALRECRRSLQCKGRLLLFEPDLSLVGLIAYGIFHHEPLGKFDPITWNSKRKEFKQGYYAAQANAHRVFVRGEFNDCMQEWSSIKVMRLPSLTYIASGGFSGPQLYPTCMYRFIHCLESLLGIPCMFSTRLLVVLEK